MEGWKPDGLPDCGSAKFARDAFTSPRYNLGCSQKALLSQCSLTLLLSYSMRERLING